MKGVYAIVGMQHCNAEKFVASLPSGEVLTLVREPTNEYDPRAIQVWARNRHIGYIPMKQNAALSALMDKVGVEIHGLLSVDGSRWPLVAVEEPQ
jgi:hypothetical protein